MSNGKRQQAEQDYIAGLKYKEIAEKYGVTLNTVKSWKTRYSWSKKVCTQNEKGVHTKKKASKPAPKEYLAHICVVWVRESITAIPKTRRMMLSWLMLSLHLWAALFHPQVAIFMQSKKERDSAFLMSDERMMFVYNHLPKGHSWSSVVKKMAVPME